jgi:pSer/pThr/pTyr-binding forkhead associated (FHA) protein
MAGLEVWGAQGKRSFELEASPVVIGRTGDCDLIVEGDDSVSRHHAVLERFGRVWQIHDLGSRNGTWINGSRLAGTVALRHDDSVNVGRTRLVFVDRDASASSPATSPLNAPPALTAAQARTLVELVRPVLRPDKPVPAPATEEQIAGRLFVSRSAVRQNLSALYDKFGIEDNGTHDRRLRLANEAIQRGAVRLADLDDRGSRSEP